MATSPRWSIGLGTFLFCSLAVFGISQAQQGPDCPLWGPVYPIPSNVLSSIAVPKAAERLRQSLDAALRNSTLGDANISFHISIYSADQVVLDYNHASPLNNNPHILGTLDKNTIFRIGSVSKLVTIYTLLAATGFRHINDPVTKWVPELANAQFSSTVDTFQWKDITIGTLASHLAGLPKDLLIAADLSRVYNTSVLEGLGFPKLSPNETITCGIDPQLPACSRQEFFNGLATFHPASSLFNMPIYSNPSFQILAYALEGITNKTFDDVFKSSLIQPLNLNGTSLAAPPVTQSLNAMIPGDEVESGWKIEAGDGTATGEGLMFSTGADLTAIGQSILSSSLLSPELTRRWLKPVTHTTDLRLSVGMPWEIARMDLPVASSADDGTPGTSATRILDLYTKNGGIGAYNCQLGLSPDHGMGFSVFVAGRPPVSGPDLRLSSMNAINRMIVETILPGFEAAALEQAQHDFAGTYIADDGNSTSPMTLTIVAGDGRLGLGVQNWTAGGLDMLVTYYAGITGVLPVTSTNSRPSLRLYPMDLRDDKQMAFRGVYGPPGNASSYSGPTPFKSYCASWASVGEPSYGNVGLEDFVFEVDESGMAIAVTARGARSTLRRKM